MELGMHPKAKAKAEAAKSMTLGATLEAFCAARQERLRPNTVSMYRKFITQRLAYWMDRPLHTITDNMVRERHRLLGPRCSLVVMALVLLQQSLRWWRSLSLDWASRKGT
jgi:hypothetical protein